MLILGLANRAPNFLERIDVQLVAQHRQLLGIDVANDIDEYGVLVAIDHYRGQTLHRALVSHSEINADILVLLLSRDDALPALAAKLFANFLRSLLHLRAILFV